MAEAENISCEVRRRRWNWIGHVLRKDPTDDCAVALGWTPEGRRKRSQPKTTWRRMVEVERNNAGCSSWNAARRAASDRHIWKDNVQALRASWHGENLNQIQGKVEYKKMNACYDYIMHELLSLIHVCALKFKNNS